MSAPLNVWKANKESKRRDREPNLKKNTRTGESKFHEAHKKLQEAVQKHLKDYESSEEEDEVEATIDTLLGMQINVL